MPDTFVKIASVTVGSGGSSSVTFSSIPSTYTDLVLKASARNTLDENAWRVRFNNDSSSIYSARWIIGNGSTAASNNNSSQTASFVARMSISTDTSNTFGNAEIYIPNYVGSNQKSISGDSVTENNSTTAFTNLAAGLSTMTSAITRIDCIPDAYNFAQHSTFTLYGIKSS